MKREEPIVESQVIQALRNVTFGRVFHGSDDQSKSNLTVATAHRG